MWYVVLYNDLCTYTMHVIHCYYHHAILSNTSNHHIFIYNGQCTGVINVGSLLSIRYHNNHCVILTCIRLTLQNPSHTTKYSWSYLDMLTILRMHSTDAVKFVRLSVVKSIFKLSLIHKFIQNSTWNLTFNAKSIITISVLLFISLFFDSLHFVFFVMNSFFLIIYLLIFFYLHA